MEIKDVEITVSIKVHKSIGRGGSDDEALAHATVSVKSEVDTAEIIPALRQRIEEVRTLAEARLIKKIARLEEEEAQGHAAEKEANNISF